MLRHRTRAFHAIVVATAGLIGSVKAQDQKPPEPPRPVGTDGSSAKQAAEAVTSVTVDKIMQQAVKNLTRRYNLNEDQAKKTEEIMRRRVQGFLKEHESEVWPLIREMLTSLQMGTKAPDDPNEAKRIGQAARPLAKLAQRAIVEGNDEWRRILAPDQRRLHDHDLAEMDQTFKQIHQNLDLWAEGKPPPGGIFPPPPKVDLSPPTPSRPAPGLPRIIEPEVVTKRESFFDQFVEQFIKENELDPGQITSARSILNEFKEKVNSFKSASAEAIAVQAAAQREAAASGDREKVAAVDQARAQLLQPVYQLFAEMEDRLTALLTSSQLSRFKERKVAADQGGRQKAIDLEIMPGMPGSKEPAKVQASKPVPQAQPEKKEPVENKPD